MSITSISMPAAVVILQKQEPASIMKCDVDLHRAYFKSDSIICSEETSMHFKSVWVGAIVQIFFCLSKCQACLKLLF